MAKYINNKLTNNAITKETNIEINKEIKSETHK